MVSPEEYERLRAKLIATNDVSTYCTIHGMVQYGTVTVTR
jgi:hypothetical protein